MLGGVPVLSFVTHLTLVDAYGLTARVAVLGEHGVEAVKAERTTVSHDVPLASELTFTLGTGEVFHMPSTAFGFGAFISKNDLKK